METPSNPYSPPQAPVSDVESVSTEKCPHIELACKIMWASFVFSILDGAWNLSRAPQPLGFVIAIIGQVMGLGIGFLIVWWITSRLRKGRNWMRWLYTILNAAAYLSVPLLWSFYRTNLFPLLKADPVATASMIIQLCLGFAVLFLLHTAETRAWFGAHRKAG
jgi:hypothetical protein